jgi:hypothetical protein
MNKIKYNDLVNEELNSVFLTNTEFIGFDEDYYVIQSLLNKWQPKSVFEIGTCTGNGSRIIRHILPSAKITTLDINVCGDLCPNDVEKIVNDSMTFDYSTKYPIDCWFIDGHHIYENAYHETNEAIKSGAKYIIYHDADIKEVYKAIMDSFDDNKASDLYDLYQVIEPTKIYSSSGDNLTRVAYAIKK